MHKKQKSSHENISTSSNEDSIVNFILIEAIILLGIYFIAGKYAPYILFEFYFMLLFFVPALPLFYRLPKLSIGEKLLVINFFGISESVIAYFIVGFLLAPISKVMFIVIPMILLAGNISIIKLAESHFKK